MATRNLQDLMCYQITKFQRTTTGDDVPAPAEPTSVPPGGTTVQDEECQDSLSFEVENSPVIVPTTITTEPKCLRNACNGHLYSCNCSSTLPSSSTVNIIQYYYCPNCERETKKARTLKFGSGGDVFVDKSHHTYYNTTGLNGLKNTSAFSNNWAKHEYSNILTNLTNKPMLPPRNESPPPSSPTIKSTVINSCSSTTIDTNNNSKNSTTTVNRGTTRPNADDDDFVTVSIKLPKSFDFNLLSNQNGQLSININIENNNKRVLSSTLSAPSATSHSNGSGITGTSTDSIRRNLQFSGWYFERMDWQDSIRELKSSPVGTFLLRDSGDPNYIFSLSIRTQHGPISSRISYRHNKFRLDSQDHIADTMPAFDNVISLIEYYIKHGLVQNAKGRQVWVDSRGLTFSPVHLKEPKRRFVPSLQHLCRLAINNSGASKKLVESSCTLLPAPLKSYLREYPHTV